MSNTSDRPQRVPSKVGVLLPLVFFGTIEVLMVVYLLYFLVTAPLQQFPPLWQIVGYIVGMLLVFGAFLFFYVRRHLFYGEVIDGEVVEKEERIYGPPSSRYLVIIEGATRSGRFARIKAVVDPLVFQKIEVGTAWPLAYEDE